MTKKSYYQKASYTIEASFIMPLIFSVIILLIYGSFYLHDKAVLSGSAYEAALYGSRIEEENKDIIREQTRKKGSQIISEKMLNTTDIITRVDVTKDKVVVTYTGKIKIPGGVLIELLVKGYGDEIQVKGNVKRIHNVEFIRDLRKIEALFNENKETEGGVQ